MVSSPAPTSTLSSALVSVLASDLRSISSSLYGSLGELGLGVVDRVDDPAGEPLTGLDDLAHPLVEVGQVLRGERPRDVEVVVEAVLDRRADAELGVRERLLHGLRQHVRGGVPDHRPAVLGVGRDRLGLGVLVRGPGQVAQPAVAVADDDDGLRTAGRQPGLPDGCARRSCPPGSSRSEWARRRGRWTRGLLGVCQLVGARLEIGTGVVAMSNNWTCDERPMLARSRSPVRGVIAVRCPAGRLWPATISSNRLRRPRWC